jgi:hypothetical protein
MVVRTLLKLWLLVREWNKGDNSNLVSAVAYLDTGKYPAWICGYLTVLLVPCAFNWITSLSHVDCYFCGQRWPLQSPGRVAIASSSSVVDLSSIVAATHPSTREGVHCLAPSLLSLPPFGRQHHWQCSFSTKCKAQCIVVIITPPLLFAEANATSPAILRQP